MGELTEKQLEAVPQLNAEYRQAHFLARIKEIGGLYIAADGNGPCLMEDTGEDEEGKRSTVLPVFSHERFAQNYIGSQRMEGAKAEFVSAAAFTDKWQPFLKENGILLAVMPVGSDFCVLEEVSFA